MFSHKLARALFGAFALCLITAVAAPAATTLTYSNFFPPTHAQSKLAQAWCDEVTKATGGEVKIQYFPGQTLTKANQSYDGVVNGISDLAMGCLAYTRGRFPVMEAVDLPLGYTSGGQATQAVNRFFKRMNPKELKDVKVMYLHAHGPGLLFTRTRPVAKLEDLKGLKIRATGTSARTVSALGGTPVAMPMPESYQSLSRGVVDGSIYPMESNKGWRLGEVVQRGTLCYPVGYTTTFFVVMNKDRWNALSPKAKEAIAKVNQRWIAKTGQAWDEADRQGREFFLSLKGRKLIPLSPAEAARWKKAVEPVLTGYAQQVTKKGLDGAAALKAAREEAARPLDK
ncbi:MAG: TRAP transporter substrate-binding protein [Desulfarculaceae bacterium]|nr:TRAP transporter substrate-binding protein [Desulfarculaceae bacterium]MCF8074185.1 TRAP transporter substrate-binding protein [Desulfarculaceae bacterium]MCF8102766.1 TRAP transporter substrate-binding protein [Desulfarculaceae bacterium]MCF8116379.1 TRAP transporter substrate-binding protein [Desulfarculaceae bacterium]